ncbi:MAG: DNA-directed RNA polymerase subunit beta [Calditrichaeota bacterium]|nr:DNA-directed RNA polymerase subunit beta [Calditrichota bacterium]RQW06251.1 MAG: DNA-directed RNA polymerase subunit beta [Calditrichota bacterium]
MKQIKAIEREYFSKIPTIAEYPDLLDIQRLSFQDFLQESVPPDKREEKGLQAVFLSTFPIVDSRENFILDFVEYYIDKPKYTVRECRERGLSYAVPLKAKLRLSIKDLTGETENYTETIEQDVYLGNLPFMTERGTFIINGAERVIVNQLHRAPGVFFDESIHPNGTKIFSARVIPFRGSWVEFMTDVNDILHVYIDRKKKFFVTTFLRSLGFANDKEILELFDLVDEVDLKKSDTLNLVGRKTVEDVVNESTGEVLVEEGTVLDEESIEALKASGIKKIRLRQPNDPTMPHLILNTLEKDDAKDEETALRKIYGLLRSGEPPDLETAKSLLDKMFFNDKRYELGKVGRYRLNKKLGLKVDVENTVLTKEDFIEIIKYLIDLREGKKATDDIDHLGNRRIRTVGEQLSSQMNLGLTRMARTIKERMNLGDSETITPQELINARAITSVINTFFGTSQLSQFMDQTNPLAELTHKRRMSALGPGGLTRERAGFEVRDIHYTHYGRLCPVETPEGPNIGLISSLCVLAKVNEFGFIETPYRKVTNGKLTDTIEYLSADDEERTVIAQFNAPVDQKSKKFSRDLIKVRQRGDFVLSNPEDIQYIDVASNQIVSPAASLIPFLEHDDANRALMGSNMQRQAVPLIQPEAPIVGTGVEDRVARDSGSVIVSPVDGVVEKLDSEKIVIKVDPGSIDDVRQVISGKAQKIDFDLLKFVRTNQNTSINQRPLVSEGDRVKSGQPIADGHATDRGELALGRNILVAFMPWNGYNFEDAIVISERIVRDDVFTSVHVEEFETQVRDTKRGEEELTREIPNVSEDATKNLDENGIIRIGAEVSSGDILVGKVTPKGETEPTPEEKLLKAIFGSKAGDVKDASLKLPSGMEGIVIDTKLFSRKKKDPKTKKEDKKKIDELEKKGEAQLRDMKERLFEYLENRFGKKQTLGIKSKAGKYIVKPKEKITSKSFEKVDVELIDYLEPWFDKAELNDEVRRAFSEYKSLSRELDNDLRTEKYKIMIGDELPPGIVQLAKIYVAQKRKIKVGDKMAGRHGNKGVVAKIVPMEEMPFLPDGTPVDIVLNPLGVPSRMNLGQIFETTLGWAGKILNRYYATPVFDGATFDEVAEEMKKAGLPVTGKMKLFDGQTGEPFDQEVGVGYIYMMKLSHMVDDKIHSRSIGPYSLITQQPLGGKAQFGGQRFGEMEVWALEAYGAAYTLQEVLTYKSDDVQGRTKVYESIVKGDNLSEAGRPESFNVLVKELQGLGLDVKVE